MLGWGVAPDLRCYEVLIDVHAHHGAGPAAAAVLDRIEAAGLAPTAETYRRLLHGLGAAGNLAVAVQVGWGGVRACGGPRAGRQGAGAGGASLRGRAAARRAAPRAPPKVWYLCAAPSAARPPRGPLPARPLD
jgi:hypothetical protein